MPHSWYNQGMKKKLWRLVTIVMAYLGMSGLVAGVFGVLSVSLLTHQQFSLASWSATVARVGVFPFRSLPVSEIRAIDIGLKIIQVTGRYEHYFSTWTEIIRLQGPLTPESLTASRQFLDQLIPLLDQLDHQRQSSSLAKHPLLSKYHQPLSGLLHFSRPTNLFLQSLEQLEPGTVVNYLVLLQNNRELRPTGGFMGSYALISFQLNQPIGLEVQDIYVPDGQLVGHVEPPGPIQEAFQTGFWKLRDANWHPDFPASAQNVQWFFEQAMNVPIHGIVAINYSTIEELFGLIGPVELKDYHQTLTAENLYVFLQHEVEQDFFPGSTQKADVLRALTNQVQTRLTQISQTEWIKLLDFVKNEFSQKEILVWSTNSTLQSQLEHQDWSGRVASKKCPTQTECFNDVFGIFDANLGVNKTNCCVQRTIQLEKKRRETGLETSTHLTYTHTGLPNAQYAPLVGDYRAYVRMYFPANTTVRSLTINEQSYAEFITAHQGPNMFSFITSQRVSISQINGLTEVGFWIFLPMEEQADIVVDTLTPMTVPLPYQLQLIRQSGTTSLYNQFSIQLDGKQLFHDTLDSDQLLAEEF